MLSQQPKNAHTNTNPQQHFVLKKRAVAATLKKQTWGMLSQQPINAHTHKPCCHFVLKKCAVAATLKQTWGMLSQQPMKSCCLSQESKKRKKNDLSDDDGSWDNFQAELEKEMDEELAKNAKKWKKRRGNFQAFSADAETASSSLVVSGWCAAAETLRLRREAAGSSLRTCIWCCCTCGWYICCCCCHDISVLIRAGRRCA